MVAAHFERAKYNRALADAYTVALPSHPEWEIVIRFYAAVHLVHAYMLTKGARFQAERHADRQRAIDASPELAKNQNFRRAYRMLRELSEQVRYEVSFKASVLHLAGARAHLDTVERVVAPKVETYLRKYPA